MLDITELYPQNGDRIVVVDSVTPLTLCINYADAAAAAAAASLVPSNHVTL